MSAPDRLSEIRERLATATAGPWTFRIWPPAESGCDAEVEMRDPAGEVVASAVGERANVEVIVHGRADLGWAVEEIGYLRQLNAALYHLAFCQDGLVWRWRIRLPERKGQRCRITARGALDSVRVEFPDGFWVVTSRSAIRRAA